MSNYGGLNYNQVPRLYCADLDRAYWASPRLALASPRLGLILIAELKSVITNSAEVALLKLLHTQVIILLKSQSSIRHGVKINYALSTTLVERRAFIY